MATQQMNVLRSLEGRQVTVDLRDGTRLDDCELVSSGRNRVAKLWLYANGEDVFVALTDVVRVWEADVDRARAA